MSKGRILDRYIFREMVSPFLLSMASLTLVLFLQKLFRLAELVVSKGATLASTLTLVAYIMPSFLIITIPMSLLVASVMAFSRLSSDSEITAMKASCVSLGSMIRPVMVFSLLAFIVTAITSLTLAPEANHALKAQLFNMVKSRAMVGIEPGVFSSTFDGMVIYVDKMDSHDNMEGIFISDERSAAEPYAVVAKRGKLIADPESLNVTLSMQEGAIHLLPRVEQAYSLMSFESGNLFLDINHALLKKDSSKRSYDETGLMELLAALKQSGAGDAAAIDIASELHKRLSIPFACLVFGLIGAPLGIRQSRSGRSAGVAIALVVFLVYYILLAGGRNLAEAGTLAPAAAYWIPNALMTVAALALVYLKGRDFSVIERATALVQWMRSSLKKIP